MDTASVTTFLAAHSAIAPFIASAFAAAETTAFLSILVPSTALLVGVGAAVSTGAIAFLPIWLGAVVEQTVRAAPSQHHPACRVCWEWGNPPLPIGHHRSSGPGVPRSARKCDD